MKRLGLNRCTPSDRARRRLRRRLSGGLLLLMALTVAGGLAAVLTPSPQVAVADESPRRCCERASSFSTRPVCPATAPTCRVCPTAGRA